MFKLCSLASPTASANRHCAASRHAAVSRDRLCMHQSQTVHPDAGYVVRLVMVFEAVEAMVSALEECAVHQRCLRPVQSPGTACAAVRLAIVTVKHDTQHGKRRACRYDANSSRVCLRKPRSHGGEMRTAGAGTRTGLMGPAWRVKRKSRWWWPLRRAISAITTLHPIVFGGLSDCLCSSTVLLQA